MKDSVQVMWNTPTGRVSLDSLVAVDEADNRLTWIHQDSSDLMYLLQEVAPGLVARYYSMPGAGVVPEWSPNRVRFVDELDLDEMGIPLTEEQAERMAKQVAEKRRWAVDTRTLEPKAHRVDDELVVIPFISEQWHVIVAKCWRAGSWMPGDLEWNQYRVDKFWPESYVDLGTNNQWLTKDGKRVPLPRRWADAKEVLRLYRVSVPVLMAEAADYAWRWAQAIKTQREYETEGYDTYMESPETRYRARLTELRPDPKRHTCTGKAGDGCKGRFHARQRMHCWPPPTYPWSPDEIERWNSMRLDPTGRYQRSPFAGMRRQGTDPDGAYDPEPTGEPVDFSE